ncbi:CAF1 family ribonuclease [Aspergillus sp. HF37]|nr:CAF1 family ribonuclease [Aspergillus sp. HF37]
MDITSQAFAFHLPRILAELATCCFVSIDLEFSGIASKAQGKPVKSLRTLQERYAETKNAAEKYQVLQIGLTICHEDTETASYTLKPYNIYLNPIIDRKLDMERDFSFQGSAVEFLLGAKFRMDSLFTDGVCYLSREEEDIAMSMALERRDGSTVRDALNVKETEHESLSFLTKVRRLIDDWLALGNNREDFLNVPPPTRSDSPGTQLFPSVLNRFQRRLVHQLIEVEYPSLVTVSKQTFIQIIAYDEDREKAVRDQKHRRTQERIWGQVGFRWVAEALAGGDLSNLDPGYFRATLNSPAIKSKDDLEASVGQLKQQVRSNRPVLVGHNLFTDVIYFCRCFFGPLPDKVEDFQAMVHGLFPVLMDTKYMATHDCGSINPTSSLTEINDSLAQMTLPSITVHHQHTKYNTQQVVHEAGYDSLLTARAFIKLSSQLREGGTSKCHNAVHDQTAQRIPHGIVHGRPSELTRIESSEATGLPIENTNRHPDQTATESHKPAANVGHRTKYDALGFEDPVDTRDTTMHPEESKMPLQAASKEVMRMVDRGELIPRFGAEFWKVYGNKLRVFGTEERVCSVGNFAPE